MLNFLGTIVPEDEPLMSAGVDSISATGLVSALGEEMCINIEATALFDYPTILSLSSFCDQKLNLCTQSDAEALQAFAT